MQCRFVFKDLDVSVEKVVQVVVGFERVDEDWVVVVVRVSECRQRVILLLCRGGCLSSTSAVDNLL